MIWAIQVTQRPSDLIFVFNNQMGMENKGHESIYLQFIHKDMPPGYRTNRSALYFKILKNIISDLRDFEYCPRMCERCSFKTIQIDSTM